MALVLVAALGVEVAIAVGADRGASRPAAQRPVRLPVGSRIDEPLGRLPLLDERGRRTSIAAFRGRWLVLAPALTLCHEVCPLTTGALERVRGRLRTLGLGGRVVVAEATVDPWRDSPARLRAFRRRTGTRVRLLTGTRKEIRRLWKAFGVEYHRVAQGDPPDRDWWTGRAETFDVAHTDGLFVVDPRGHWRVVVAGMPDSGGSVRGRLASLLNDTGRANLRRPRMAWTVDGVLGDLLELMGRPLPPPATARATAGHVLRGGPDAVRAKLAALRGRPVVVNEWASWCPPCREEMPLLAGAARRYRGRVAFVGLDVNDQPAPARRLAAHDLLGYPSYSDPGAKAASSLAAFVGLPTTVFIGASGRVRFTHMGQYASSGALERDIDRYALGSAG